MNLIPGLIAEVYVKRTDFRNAGIMPKTIREAIIDEHDEFVNVITPRHPEGLAHYKSGEVFVFRSVGNFAGR